MKRRSIPSMPDSDGLELLTEALARLDSASELRAFIEDLCTPAEIQALVDRWRVVPLLLDGVPYREIHERTGVSVTTIGRVARCIDMGAGGYRLAAHRLGHTDASH